MLEPSDCAPTLGIGSKVTGGVPRGSERILVADDQANLLMLMERLLVRAGYSVTTVSNGADAVAAAARETFDLHILDAVMPELGGREARERIREGRGDARFLFLSGYGREALPEAYVRAHGIELLAKPFDPDTLLRAVRAELDAGRDQKGSS